MPVRKQVHALRQGWAYAIVFMLAVGLCGGVAAEELRVGGTGAALGTMRLLADKFIVSNPDVRVTIIANLGSGGGIKAALAGAINLAVSSRPINESERKLGAVELEYARTPFVFAVSGKSGVTAISSRQLEAIYDGTLGKWPDGSPVRVILRPVSDIDTEMIKNISPAIRSGLESAETRSGVQFSVSDQDAANDLERIPGAIGPSTLAVILSEKRALRALKFDGREPTPMNAATGVYPYYKRLFFVTGDKRPAVVERFVAFVQSPAGRNILTRYGQWIP